MHHQPHTSLSSNEVLLSLPQPSLAHSAFSNRSADAGCIADSLDSVSNVQKLIVHQVRPIRYGPAVKASQGTFDMPKIFHNPWRDSWARQINQTKITNPFRCQVCKIDLNSKIVFEAHISGKKHKKNLQLHNNPNNTSISSGTVNVNFQIQDSGVQGQELSVDAGKDLKSRKRKLLGRGEAELADQAVETSQGTSDMPTIFHHPWRDSWVHQINQTKISKQMRCEVCKIDLNSKSVFEDHISGKKHKKNMQLHNNPSNTISSGTASVNFQIQDSGVQVQELFVDVGKDLKSMKRTFLSRGQSELADQFTKCSRHNSCIKHKLSRQKHLNDKCEDGWLFYHGANSSPYCINCEDVQAKDPTAEPLEKLDTSNQELINSHKPEIAFMLEAPEKDVETKKQKCELEGGAGTSTSNQSNVNNEEVIDFPDFPARCEICSIDRNSEQVYISHLSGKKHKRNLEKVSQSENDGASAAAAIMTTKQAIRPQEKRGTSPQEGMDTYKSGNAVMLEVPEKDFERERLKIEPFCGAAITFFIVCRLCNVSCYSEAVFNSHLHGKKHAAMVKKLEKSR